MRKDIMEIELNMNEKEENKVAKSNCVRRGKRKGKGEAERKDANKNESNKGNDDKIEKIKEWNVDVQDGMKVIAEIKKRMKQKERIGEMQREYNRRVRGNRGERIKDK